MAIHRKIFKEHTIIVSTHEVRGGLYTWSYTIDGGHYYKSDDRPLDYEEMLVSEAFAHAQYRIDTGAVRF